MNHPLLVNVKREDFGFVVARALAIILWILGARNLPDLAKKLILAFVERRGVPLLHSLATIGPTIAYVVALGYVGYRLWTQANRFGGSSAQRGQNDSMVMASQTLLMCGLAMGISFFPVVFGAYTLVQGLILLVQANGTQASPSSAAGSLVSAVFDLLLGAAVFGWAYSSANKVQVPDLEYDQADAAGPT